MRNSAIFFVVLFLAILTFGGSPPSSVAQETASFIGSWAGSISAAGATVEFSITFSLDQNAQMKGTIDVPAQGVAGIRLGNIRIEGSKISFNIDDPAAQGNPAFEGELKDTKKTIAGTFSQSGVEGTFSMDKKGPKSDLAKIDLRRCI